MDLKTRLTAALGIPASAIWLAGDVIAVHPSYYDAIIAYADSHQQHQYKSFLRRNMRLSAHWYGGSRSLAVLHTGDLDPTIDFKGVVPCYPIFSMGRWVDVEVSTLGIGYATSMATSYCFDGQGGHVIHGNINRCYDYVLTGVETARPNALYKSDVKTPDTREYVWNGATQLSAKRFEYRGQPVGSSCDIQFGSHLLLNSGSSLSTPGLAPSEGSVARAFSAQLPNTEFGLPESDWRDVAAYASIIPTAGGVHGRRNWIVIDGPALASFGIIDMDGSTVVGATRRYIAAHLKDSATLIPNCGYDAARYARVQANLLRDPDGLMVAVRGFADMPPWYFSSALRPYVDHIEANLDVELSSGTKARVLKDRWIAEPLASYKLGVYSAKQATPALSAGMTLPSSSTVEVTVTEEGVIFCALSPVDGLTLDTAEEFFMACLLAGKTLNVNYTADFALCPLIARARESELKARAAVADLAARSDEGTDLTMPVSRQLDIGNAIFSTTFIDQDEDAAKLELPLSLLSPGYLRRSLLPKSMQQV